MAQNSGSLTDTDDVAARRASGESRMKVLIFGGYQVGPLVRGIQAGGRR
jgi:hypothetical protein